jgi:hypothetical protein
VSIVGQIASALDAAHGAGLVHRDVKPGNVLVAANSDHVYLTDFGLTKAASSASGFTATGQFVGTTDYCAPEQIQGRQVDGRTDVYSLGCVLYECLTGSPPFARENDLAVMYAHMQDPPPTVTAVRRDLPQALDQVIATAMAKKKENRYPSCSAMAGALRTALEVGTGRSLPTVPLADAGQSDETIAPGLLGSGSFTRPEQEAPVYPPAAPYPAQPIAGYAPPTMPPPPPMAAPEAPRRGWLTAAAVIVAALLVAGGGTAAALIVMNGKKDTPPQRVAQPAPVSQPKPEPKPKTTLRSHPNTPSAPTTPAPTNTAADEQEARQAVIGHWAARKSGDYESAWNFLTTPYTGTQNRSSWISDLKDDGTDYIDVEVGRADLSGDTGSVHLKYANTHSAAQGDQCFTGAYAVRKVNGRWLISDPRISRC